MSELWSNEGIESKHILDWRQFVESHRDDLYTVFVYVFNDFSLAELATETAFISSMQSQSITPGHSSDFLSLYRAGLESEAASRSPNGADIAEIIETARKTSDRAAKILELTMQLTYSQRAALILRELRKLNYEQIAQILKTDEQSVRYAISQARAFIVKNLQSE